MATTLSPQHLAPQSWCFQSLPCGVHECGGDLLQVDPASSKMGEGSWEQLAAVPRQWTLFLPPLRMQGPRPEPLPSNCGQKEATGPSPARLDGGRPLCPPLVVSSHTPHSCAEVRRAGSRTAWVTCVFGWSCTSHEEELLNVS
uniref:Uncharacterized protein n=1 Tax=Molossus molossus TaxID=27622 RepID=A0A7J8EE70_MOLMO|nr:hypothetical protein HJG59_008834 [Molossus molossus]